MLNFIKWKRLILHFHAWENARYTLNGKIKKWKMLIQTINQYGFISIINYIQYLHISLLHLWWCSSYNTDYKIVGYLSVSVKSGGRKMKHLLMWKARVTELRMGHILCTSHVWRKGLMANFYLFYLRHSTTSIFHTGGQTVWWLVINT